MGGIWLNWSEKLRTNNTKHVPYYQSGEVHSRVFFPWDSVDHDDEEKRKAARSRRALRMKLNWGEPWSLVLSFVDFLEFFPA